MRIVLDTNVLISGMLTPFGTCGEIVRMLTSGNITLCVDARILFEYQNVLCRPTFRIDPDKISIVMNYIEDTSESSPTIPLSTPLPDPDDEQFLEVALSAAADCLVTGNLKHYPVSSRAGAKVLSPRQFIDFFRKFGTTI